MAKLNDKARQWYDDALASLPASGGGGCHAALLGVANKAQKAGLTEAQVFADLRHHVHGRRPVTDKEISDAISKAYSTDFKATHQPPPIMPDARQTRHRYVMAGRDKAGSADPADLELAILNWSPVEIPVELEQHGIALLQSIYQPDDLLFIGDHHDTGKSSVRSASEWQQVLNRDGNRWPHFVINPLSGRQATSSTGRPSYRCDNAVERHLYTLAEFDSVPLDEQLAFWVGMPAPVAALIDSGGKSIHALIRVDCVDAEEYAEEVEQQLFKRVLVPLGVDPACRNEARLSRMPGHYRREKKRHQRLIYLNPEPALGGVGHE